MIHLVGLLEHVSWLYVVCERVYILLFGSMHGRKARLSSIAERSEAEEEQTTTKWVPKQKHEFLKAKYKCLKKLFQVYDASLINMLPNPEEKAIMKNQTKDHRTTKKTRRTHKRKADSEKATTDSEPNCKCIASAVLKDLKLKKCTLGPTLVDQVSVTNVKCQFPNVKSIKTESEDCISAALSSTDRDKSSGHGDNIEYAQNSISAVPTNYLLPKEMQHAPKMTRMQIFKFRLFGKRPKPYRYSLQVQPQVQSLSDPRFVCEDQYCRHIPHRRPRLRRHRTRQVRSCDELLAGSHPVLLSCMQNVQQSCLVDTTPRSCPFPGCSMTLNGIINYNDHLRLCHFPERKFVCHYCHEGFESELQKIAHENEHIGIFKPSKNTSSTVVSDNYKHSTSERDKHVQCDVISEEKLKKIVSYFDKIAIGDASSSALGKRFGIDNSSRSIVTQKLYNNSARKFNKNPMFGERAHLNSRNSSKNENVAIACKICGDLFTIRNHLSSHMDLEHRGHSKSSKFHSICSLPVKATDKDGELNVDTIQRSRMRNSCSDLKNSVKTRNSSCAYAETKTPTRNSSSANIKHDVEASQSGVTVDYDPSTNIVYYNLTSMESICKKSSVFNRLVKKVKSVSSLQNHIWEPDTKIVHV